MSQHPIMFSVAALALVAANIQPSVAAPIFIVNSTADVVAAAPLDSGPCETAPGNDVCTLRAAIMKANHMPGGGATIRFGLPGVVTYLLSIPRPANDSEGADTGDLNIRANVTIEGNGSGNTIIDGNGTVTGDRIFQIDQGVTVRMAGITLQNGLAPSGGAIHNRGTLTMERSIIRNNKVSGGNIFAVTGGGIDSIGSLVLNSVTVSSNSAIGNPGEGGGIYANLGTLQMVDSTVSGNAANYAGGGLWTGNSQSSILRSTISGNGSVTGGGITVQSGALVVVDSTLSGNSAEGDGGGLWANGPSVRLYNTTVALNTANVDAVGAGLGGGIFAEASSTVTLTNSLVAHNFYRTRVGPAMNLAIINNDCKGSLSTAGPNLFLFNDPTNCTINGGATFGDPKIGGLAANGGPTLTHALETGSPAIDAGEASGCTDSLGAPLATDQRGAPRAGARCDLGAFEVGPLFTLDVDASVSATRYDPFTDGLLILRHLFGLTGSPLTAGATAGTATRTDSGVIRSLLDGNQTALDVDGNGVADALTDGMLIVRHLFGLTGSALTKNAIGFGAHRNTAQLIEAYLQTLKP